MTGPMVGFGSAPSVETAACSLGFPSSRAEFPLRALRAVEDELGVSVEVGAPAFFVVG